jgi:hypothetical protein
VGLITTGSAVGCTGEKFQSGQSNASTPLATSSYAATPSPPPDGDRWTHPFPTNGWRYAFPQEVAAASGVSVTSEVDRGSSGCTYNNGEDLGAALAGAPKLVKGSQGLLVINPLIPEVRQHRSALASLLKQLKIPDVEPAAGQDKRSTQARAAAMSRWQKRWTL